MKTKLIVVALLVVAFGQPVGTAVQAQRPPGKHPRRAHGAAMQAPDSNAATAQIEAQYQYVEPDVVRVSRQNLPQDPLRVRINDAVQKGMQAAKLSVAVQNVCWSSAYRAWSLSSALMRRSRVPSCAVMRSCSSRSRHF